MDKNELWNYLIPMMEQDPDYQQALQKMKEIEPKYLALLETMTAENQEILEQYITACENMDDPLIFLAYQIGRNRL